MQYFNLILIFYFFIKGASLLEGSDVDSVADGSRSVIIDCFSAHYKQKLQESLPEHFYLESIVYDVDFSYDTKELSYLTDLRSHETVTLAQVLKACFYLRQIDRFNKVELIIKKKGKGYAFTFYCFGHEMFTSLSVSGYMRGKEGYKNAYLLDVGEIFDEQKHRHSLEDIKKIFYEKGFCKAQIIDKVERNDKQKTVKVALALSRGFRFVIGDIHFHINSVGSISQVEVERMQRKIEAFCFRKLKNKSYSSDLIKKVEQKVLFLLKRYGFMNFDLSIKEKLHNTAHKVSIDFHIVLEQKKEFVFFGNNFFKKQDLLDHLLMYGKSSWHFPGSIIIDELMQLYKSKGFWNVDISIREEKNRVFCLINEGARISVAAVHFKDNDHFLKHKLIKNGLKTFLNTKYFDKDILKKSIDQLIRFYRQQGFWDIKVVKEEFVTTSKKNVYELFLTLDEGKQKKIKSYIISGYKDLEKQGPFARLKKESNFGFDPMIILEQKQWLLRYFKNLGYYKVGVEYELQENEDGTLNVIWNISLHDQAVKFGKPLVIGNSAISQSYIIREAGFKKGDAWDKNKLEETLKRLREFETFDSVQIYPSRDVDEDLEKPVFIKVIDADRYEVRTRMGLQQVGRNLRLRRGFTYKIGGSFFIRNPLCFGDRLVLEGDFTKFYRNFSCSYYFPWLFKYSIRCQYKAYDTLYNQPVYIGTKNSLYQAGQRGFLFNMTKRFLRVTLSGTGGVEFMGIKEADQHDLHTIIDYDQSLLDKKTGYVFLEPSIMWQKLDNIINPKKGHLSFVSCKAMIDFDTKTSFIKLLAEHSIYLPLHDQLVCALRLRFGHVFNKKYEQLIPIERFLLGGANSLRGYERDYCPPLGLLTDPIKDEHAGLPAEACNIWRYAPQGGRTMINLNTELRLSLYKNFGVVIFNDFGALFKDSIHTMLQDKSNNFLAGSGLGLRYDTPIGPLRFDIGVKWHKIIENFESRWATYLTLGHAF